MIKLHEYFQLSSGVWTSPYNGVNRGTLEPREIKGTKFVQEVGENVLHRVHPSTYRSLLEVQRRKEWREERAREWERAQEEKRRQQSEWLERLKAWKEAHWSEELDGRAEPSMAEKRAEFARWLIAHGKLSEGVEA